VNGARQNRDDMTTRAFEKFTKHAGETFAFTYAVALIYFFVDVTCYKKNDE